jgi:hypothetical protein
MDGKLYLATLRQQGAYLGQLVTELNTALQILERALDEGNTPPLLEATAFLEEVDGLEKRLSLETEMLWKRLHLVLAASQIFPRAPGKP